MKQFILIALTSFLHMSMEEKLAVIQSGFQRLYDPSHPVRNNMETLEGIEEVRITKEALK